MRQVTVASNCRQSTLTTVSGPETAFSAVVELDLLLVSIVGCYVTPVGNGMGESIQLTEVAHPVGVAFGLRPPQD